jgi:glycosyltransferase involved in cell wall biosynthesis
MASLPVKARFSSPRATLRFLEIMISPLTIRHFKTRLKDNVHYSNLLRNSAGLLYWLGGVMSRGRVRKKRLARAGELSESPFLARIAARKLAALMGPEHTEEWRQNLKEISRYQSLIKKDPSLSRSIILKALGPNGEKGVLMLTFEYNWARFLLGLSDTDFDWFEKHFQLILSTSSSPTHYTVLAAVVSRSTQPVYVQACNVGDIARLEQLHPRVRCLPCMPCDWLNPTLYRPRPFAERDVDFLMVAFWGDVKRHFEFFEALAKMPRSLKVVLIGTRDETRGVEWIRALAREYGVPQELEIHQSIPIEEVAAYQCRAKVSLILSRREGCCVAAVESLFGGSALALREGAHIGPLAYINNETGQALRPGHVPEDLMSLLKRAETMAPAEWAMRKLSYDVTWKKINQWLKEQTVSEGGGWTQDIALPHWRPHPTYALEEDQQRLRPCYEDLHRRFPSLFRADLMETSHL